MVPRLFGDEEHAELEQERVPPLVFRPEKSGDQLDDNRRISSTAACVAAVHTLRELLARTVVGVVG
jgi:hypothetical protein